MPRITKALAALNDVIGPIRLPGDLAHNGSLYVPSGSAGDGTFLVEVNDGTDLNWAPVKLTNGGTLVAADSIAGAANAQWATFELNGMTLVRGRKSDAGDGDAVLVTLIVRGQGSATGL